MAPSAHPEAPNAARQRRKAYGVASSPARDDRSMVRERDLRWRKTQQCRARTNQLEGRHPQAAVDAIKFGHATPMCNVRRLRLKDLRHLRKASRPNARLRVRLRPQLAAGRRRVQLFCGEVEVARQKDVRPSIGRQRGPKRGHVFPALRPPLVAEVHTGAVRRPRLPCSRTKRMRPSSTTNCGQASN